MRISTIRENVVCPVCQLNQFERADGNCRRCHHPLGVSYIEILLSNPPRRLEPEDRVTIRMEVGGLIRTLRSRLVLTQTAVASQTGIHRTYLSRVERGLVAPSLPGLLNIFRALGVDKIMLRLRS